MPQFAIFSKKPIFVVVLFVATLTAHAQQLFSYSQYMDNLVPVNAAWSLLNKDGGTIYSNMRKQWAGVNGSPTSYMLNINFPINQVNGAAGFILTQDKLAVEQKTQFSVFFAKNIPLNDNANLAVSLNAGIYNYTTQYADLDPNDPVIQNDINENKPNVGFGILFYTDTYFLGLSVPQVSIRKLGVASLQDNNSFRNNYYFTGGFSTDIDDDIKMKPSTLVSYTRGVPVIADISNIFYLQDTFGLGANYRTNNEVAALLSVDVDIFHIGYSYQFGTSALNVGGFSNATHEFSLVIHFGRAYRSVLPHVGE